MAYMMKGLLSSLCAMGSLCSRMDALEVHLKAWQAEGLLTVCSVLCGDTCNRCVQHLGHETLSVLEPGRSLFLQRYHKSTCVLKEIEHG